MDSVNAWTWVVAVTPFVALLIAAWPDLALWWKRKRGK